MDVRQNFNLSAVLQSPTYSKQLLRWVAGGWQLAPIVSAHTGADFTVSTGVDTALSGVSTGIAASESAAF